MASVYTYINDTGLIIPDTATIQSDVQTEYQNAFGTDLNVTDPNTPQGLLINAETQARIAVVNNNATLANQINPNLAGGLFLDAILALMGSERIPASNSTVVCTLGGVPGTIIPQGALAVDVNGNQWSCNNVVTIPSGGSISGITFTAVDFGPIVVTSGQLNSILSNVVGWETITNPNANSDPTGGGTVGQNTQTDISARQYRINTLYLQSNGLAGSIIAALSATQTVNSLSFLENPTSSPATVNNVAMGANSIYCCIDGTNQQAIAAALTASKSAGCAYTNGASLTNISYNYTVPISGQVITVKWDNPDIVTISVKMTVVLYTPVQDYVTTVKNAITAYAAGQVNGLRGFVVGANVSPFEISAAVGIQYPGIYVSNCQISQSLIQTGVLNTTNTVTGLKNATIVLSPGMTVTGTDIPPSTTISSITNDTTIVLSNAATGSLSTPLTFESSFGSSQITLQPWQLPKIGAITVNT